MRHHPPSLLVLLLLLAARVGAESGVAIKVLTEPPGARVLVVRMGAEKDAPPEFVGEANGKPLILRAAPGQESLTLILDHWLCEPRRVTVELQPYRSYQQDTLGPVALQYRSVAHRLLGFLQPWRVALLVLALLAVGAYLRHWRAAEAVRKQAELDSSQAAQILNRIVPAAGDPMVGALLDDYRLVRRLGTGGMARVYLGESEDGKESVAIKILDAELASDEQFVRRFAREKDVYSDLNHPNIVRVLGFGYFQEYHYLVMELIRGTTLRDRISPDGMSAREALELIRPVCKALTYAHSRGIIHRDLKPENVMVTDEGKVKVMDFGMASGTAYSAVTVTGSLLGTPAYMAPEQAQGELNPSSDQYAVGVMLFEMLAGRPPFTDDNPVNIIFKHLSDPAPMLVELRPELEGVGAVVNRMLAKDPLDRYPDIAGALQALERVIR